MMPVIWNGEIHAYADCPACSGKGVVLHHCFIPTTSIDVGHARICGGCSGSGRIVTATYRRGMSLVPLVASRSVRAKSAA